MTSEDGVQALYSFAPKYFSNVTKEKNISATMRVKSNFQNQLFGRTTWVECTWWARPSSLLPFPPFLYKPFLYYFNPFCPRRAFISAQGSGAPPRRRQKGLWRSWTCDGGKHPKSVKTMARRVGRTGHMLLRLKYFPFLLISIEDEEGVVWTKGGRCISIFVIPQPVLPSAAVTFIIIFILINEWVNPLSVSDL